MGIIVQKYGGSSVANVERLHMVAEHIMQEQKKGNQVVVVVSAQGKTTDNLIEQEKEITSNPRLREHDVLVSTGEQITIAKLAMLLNELNCNAVSLTGWQVPIITNSDYANSRIRYIHNETILEYLSTGNVVIIAGFQGVDECGNITTLGRGGSDTTAVALAASLNAERCDIYTDVDGVYTSDPRFIKNVKKLDSISYNEMIEFSSMGAKVLHNRCVEIAKKYNVALYVKSTFEKESVGTLIGKSNLEDLTVNGVIKDDYVSRITIVGLENNISKTYEVFKLLADNRINSDLIVQSFGENTIKDISFTVRMNDLYKTNKLLENNKQKLGFKQLVHAENLSKVSVIGVGISNNPNVAAQILEALTEKNINMHMISSSESKISILVDIQNANTAMQSIHDKFFN